MPRVFRKSSLLNYSVGLVVTCAALLVLWPGLLRNLLRTGTEHMRFMTHAECYQFIGPLVWMHFTSDLLIWLSYVSISLTLAYLVYRARRDIPFHWVFLAFGLFIIACGFTHFMEVLTTFGPPRYWLAGYVKLVTAVASVATAAVLPPLVPRILDLVRDAKFSSRRLEVERTLSALRETNRKLEAIIAASPLAIITLDERGRVESWSAAAERIFGWRELEVVGEPLPTVPDEQREAVARNHAEAVAGRVFSNFEARRRRRDGTPVDVSISTAPLSDAEGRSRGVVAVVGDVTERKRAEAALRFQAHLLDTVEQAVIATDAEGRITYWNRFAESLYGWTAAEVAGRDIVEITPAETSRAQAKEILERLAAGESWTGELTLRRRDGSSFPALVTDTPILDERGEVAGVVGVSTDITARKHAEEALRESEARFRSLADSAPVLIWVNGLAGCEFVNQQYLDFLGRTMEEVLSMDWATALHPEDADAYLGAYARAFEARAPFEAVVRFLRADGEYRWIKSVGLPRFTPDRTFLGYVGSSFDVTDIKLAGEALRVSETRFRTLVEQSPFSTQIFSPDGATVRVNRAWERLWGVTLADLPGYNILADEQLAAKGVMPFVRRAFDGEATTIPPIAYEPDRGEFAGQGRWVQAFIYPVKNEDGTVREVVLVHDDITERKRAEDEALRLSAQVEGERRRLKELVAHVPGVVWEAWGEPDASSQRINFVSDHVETMLGYTVEEWLATPNFWLTIVHPEDQERAARDARAKFDSRRGGASQFRWVRKDGRAVEVEAQSVIICDERGEPVGMRGVTMDITERRRVEEALRYQYQLTSTITENVAEGLCMTDAEGRVTYLNPAAEEISGWTLEELRGRPLHDAVHFLRPDGSPYPAEECPIVGVLATGVGVRNREDVWVRKGGQLFPVFVSCSPLDGGGGRVAGAVLSVQDITERKASEGALRESQARLEGIVESAMDAIVTVDEGQHVVLFNRAAEKMFRLAAAEAIGRPLEDLIPARFRPDHSDHVRAFGETGVTTRAMAGARAVAGLRADGTEFPLEASISQIEAGGRKLYTVIMRDITERRRTEQERELLLAREREARQEAEQANRAKDEFLATLSHELRTPLTPIIGWLHLLGGDQLAPAELRHGLAVIDKNSQALSRLINDLLDMSAILNGKMRIDRLPVEVDDAIRHAVETVRTQADRLGVRLEFAPCDEGGAAAPAVVSGDRTRLVQVFWNLLSNAVKFSDHGGLVRVGCRREEAQAVVSVEDEGVGIPAEFLPHVFDRFRQADMSTTKVYGGLGIGLSLVRSFVEAHGGTVSAESAGAGRGSRFTVRLPLAGTGGAGGAGSTTGVGEGAQEGETARTPPAPAGAKPAAPDPLSVLIVEDAPDTLEMLRLFFEGRGHRAAACRTAEEALDVATGRHFDIIVSDIGLPQIDGYELLRRLRRERPHLSKATAVALTGYASERDVAAAAEAGFDAHVAKPFDPEALAALLERLLAGSAPGSES